MQKCPQKNGGIFIDFSGGTLLFIVKYGIVCTSHTSNLGDDIQSLAAVHLSFRELLDRA